MADPVLLVEVVLEADPVLLSGYLLVEVVLGGLQERRLHPHRLLVALLHRSNRLATEIYATSLKGLTRNQHTANHISTENA